MIVDAAALHGNGSSPAADVVIVGAGTVGLFVAMRLADRGASVVVVEAGGRIAKPIWDGLRARSIGKLHRGVIYGRAIGLGGTSAMWGGGLAELIEGDLSREGRSWPFSYQELSRWYAETYRQLGLSPQKSEDQYRRALNIPGAGGDAVEQFFTSILPQPNFATLFQGEMQARPNVQILLGATANDISFAGPAACSIAAATASGEAISVRGRSFIFAAGTIANAQFFLTTQRRSAVPWQNNSSVGARFHDHLGGKAAEVLPRNAKGFRQFFESGFAHGRKLQPKLRYPAGSQSPISICGFFAFRSSRAEQLTQLKELVRNNIKRLQPLPLAGELWRQRSLLAPMALRYSKDRRIMALFDEGVDFFVQSEQLPLAQSKICPSGETLGANGLLGVAVDWRVDGAEAAGIRQFVCDAGRFLKSRDLADMRPEAFVETTEGVVEKLHDLNHQCGGLCMGEAPAESVTDADCRVWGTQNVYVAGASVMPSSGYANCTLTALALGARLADHIAMGLKRGSLRNQPAGAAN